jgi:hypothetical protein
MDALVIPRPGNPPEVSPVRDLSVVLLILGDLFRIETELGRTLKSLQASADQLARVICVLDGAIWNTLPLIQTFRLKMPRLEVIDIPEALDLPGCLINRALEAVKEPFVTFVWPGVAYDPGLAAKGCTALAHDPDAALAYSWLDSGTTPGFAGTATLVHHGHIQQADLVPMAGTVYRSDHLREAKGCDPNPLLQRYPGWDLAMRLSRVHDVAYVEACPGGQAPDGLVRWKWAEFPFVRTLPFSLDQVHRTLLRQDRFRIAGESGTREVELHGLDESDERRLVALSRPLGLTLSRKEGPQSLQPPIRVAVTGGLWEPTHNQLCFFNHFETPEGRERFHWKTILDADAKPEDVEDSDLVIVSRGRCGNVLSLIRACEERGIPTLYMIDDNWFTVAREWPAYAELFSPGRPDYEVFVEALRRCSGTLVYNELLRDYVAEHARQVFCIDVNVTLGPRLAPRRPDQPSFTIGYAGSPRYTDAAFVALERFVREHPDAVLLLFGSADLAPGLRDLAEQGRLLRYRPACYLHYRRKIESLRPDVLLAPLDVGETSRSKCFNKFLEITAAGAVGIYTEMEPYTRVVQGGINGLLVPEADNDRPDAWYVACERLHRNRVLRQMMFENAWHLVSRRYETRKVFPQFQGVVRSLLAGEGVIRAAPLWSQRDADRVQRPERSRGLRIVRAA